MARNNLTLKQKARYMGDTNMWLHSVTLGWRWVNNSLRFSMVWRMYEIEAGMKGLQHIMVLTMESVD